MMVDIKDCSPWWYAECSATEPANWATLISDLSLRLKHVKMTLKILPHERYKFISCITNSAISILLPS